MSFNKAHYEKIADEATTHPGTLVNAMAERDGEAAGGLTLTREHIITINEYANFAFALPATAARVEQWLGYRKIDEPELTPSSMGTLFTDLRGHAATWTRLSDTSKALSSQLASTANLINTTGNRIVKACENLSFLEEEEAWENLEFDDPIILGDKDKRVVRRLSTYMAIIKEDVAQYASRVADVKKSSEVFRNTITTRLLPTVGNKDRALKRKQQDGLVERLRGEIKEYDTEIAALKKEYDKYLTAGLSGLAGGLIGAAVGGTIYGIKAEKVRKERQRLERLRKQAVAQLKARENLEGRIKELVQFVDDLDARLRDVGTSAAHLQSAWASVGVYIDTSIKVLAEITDGQELWIFITHFMRFLGQWESIETTSLQLNRVFDDALSAR
ncbi:alpha-xenorhabdolysin family binary toxin subunit A [Pseudomonas entomophila]|uniref:alpha-xenorhabdolysin family binary toxin subunit A n=1 Tax=Pseudomonas entomophila TaxID=312306 RepID=UPI002406CCCF|nr:alpha-xenorhabdolysin family binary toxin subunit A [Pseudomonas entomophila]MDF9620744.1 alpha-xenorhabdolysin family binary toxin subunit A [Pseudomonas entomophila]